MLVLGIETSCDETAAAVVDGEYRVRSNVVYSQEDHAPYGGVVPELASRAHMRTLVPVVQQALARAGLDVGQVDGIAVTRGPGLVGSLIVGLSLAKTLALAAGKPFYGVHHLEGHLFANRIGASLETPFLALLVSGGHSELVEVVEWGHYRLLGRTRDDAAGEAFDKVAKLLGLLPEEGVLSGGRALAQCAEAGDPQAIPFPRGLDGEDTLDFSFSGVKTAVLNHVRRLGPQERRASLADIAASFQVAVVDALVKKTVLAMQRTGARRVALAGGVAANRALREGMRTGVEARGGHLHCPEPALCTDNGAMVAAAGLFHLARGERSPMDLDAVPRLPL
ncbi:MAG: tRNA (adenosine(37)-N6)-threonylcarbamoyltransferase complex transferase subunit TsaD [Candidatus Latescibacterota bacterium]